MNEIWKPIENYENYYLVSNLGKVKSLDRITKNGSGYFLRKGKLLKNNINNMGYCYLYLKKDNISKKFYLHRLVAQAFIPNPENKKEVNHIDCDPLNNAVSNLEWVSHKENMGYMSKLGRSDKKGSWLNKIIQSNSKHWKPVLQIDKVSKKVIREYSKLKEVKEFGFLPSSVCVCCRNIRKTHKGYIWRYANDRNS